MSREESSKRTKAMIRSKEKMDMKVDMTGQTEESFLVPENHTVSFFSFLTDGDESREALTTAGSA